MGTCVPHPESPSHLPLFPPPSPSHPSGLSQSTSFECPASWTKFALVIYFTYGNIYISMLFSEIIPPHLLLQSPKICSLHLCLFCCLAYRVVVIVFLNSINMCSHTVLVFLFRLTSLCIISPDITRCSLGKAMLKHAG